MTTILLVHDQSGSREAIRKYLEDQGDYQVIEAHSGNNAIEIIRENSHKGEGVISAVICRADMRRPRGSGIDLLKVLKDKFRLSKLRFILFEVRPFIEYEGMRVGLPEIVGSYKGQRVHFCLWEKYEDSERFLNLLPVGKLKRGPAR